MKPEALPAGCQVAARNQGALSAQLEVLLSQLRLNPATLKALQNLDFSPMGYACTLVIDG